ncbi:myb-related transcription factor, partner of profilin-like [Ananas comosus]|uniref:Myb-related transcription factor, partner of profilin-like n=1 Tax=Ananas comosus TaxID=4615 RepID=A0A6P5FH25_ANACO|nr:myb-related transcription factor, partner of profilin-like [Ananas comosus]
MEDVLTISKYGFIFTSFDEILANVADDKYLVDVIEKLSGISRMEESCKDGFIMENPNLFTFSLSDSLQHLCTFAHVGAHHGCAGSGAGRGKTPPPSSSSPTLHPPRLLTRKHPMSGTCRSLAETSLRCHPRPAAGATLLPAANPQSPRPSPGDLYSRTLPQLPSVAAPSISDLWLPRAPSPPAPDRRPPLSLSAAAQTFERAEDLVFSTTAPVHHPQQPGIRVVAALPNELLAAVVSPPGYALRWVQRNVAAYYPAIQIAAMAVDNEMFASPHSSLIALLVPAMTNVHAALMRLRLDGAMKSPSPSPSPRSAPRTCPPRAHSRTTSRSA